MLEIESVQKELKLTETQPDQLREIERKEQRQVRLEMEKSSGIYPSEKIKTIDEVAAKEVDNLLLPEQSKRLRQLELQNQLPDNLGVVLQGKDVVAALKLSKEQQEKIAAIEEDNTMRVGLLDREISVGFGRGGPGGGPGFGT